MKIILSSNNPSKIRQIKAVFSSSPIQVLSLADAGISGEAIEDGNTLEANALKKAYFARGGLSEPEWVMSDDSGIFITALDGEPGVHSAYWGGAGKATEQITEYCLERMRTQTDRSAIFRTVVAAISPDGTEHFFKGEVRGKLLESPRCKPQPKMPYSPLFVPDGENLCWAEMTIEHENRISHRGKAFRLAREFLEKAAG